MSSSAEGSGGVKVEGNARTVNSVVLQNDVSAVTNTVKLNGSNYPLWSKVLEMHIAGRGRKGFVTGSTKEPGEESADYEAWETGNAIVKGWLINSMEPTIMGFFIHLRTAKEVWEEVARTYYDGSDISQIYELKVKSFRLRQEGRQVGVYYADLKSVWQELDQRRPIKMECAVDLKTLREEIQLDRVYAFLAGLDDVFDKVRSDILRIQPLPSVEEVFSVVRREAQRHATMMGGGNNQGGVPSMAMISRPTGASRSNSSSNPSFNSRAFNRENKDDLKCNFCGQTRHTEDTYFAKHGVPDWFPELKKKLRAKERGAAGSSGGRASLAAAAPTTHEAVPCSSDSSQNLLTRPRGDSSSATGTMGRVLLASETQHHTGWILDSGATDHMTYDKNMFQYMTTSHRKNISTANGTLAAVCGAGTVHLTPSLPLHHCLLVPSLSHHLLSLPQVTEQLDCVVLMYPSFCLLQDIQTKEIIGRGTKREGLYYVDDVASGRAHAVRASRSSNLQEVWLLHRRLGHASFGYLRHMLPSLFSGINESDLHCEVCILAKSHRASFPSSMNKRALPFELVHSDV